MAKKPTDSKNVTPQPDASANVVDNGYKCMRNTNDGSMYYGEVAYIRRSNGQLIKPNTPAYEEVKALSADERNSQFQMVRHGHGLQLFSGQANEDGIVTKYEGGWSRDKKHG